MHQRPHHIYVISHNSLANERASFARVRGWEDFCTNQISAVFLKVGKFLPTWQRSWACQGGLAWTVLPFRCVLGYRACALRVFWAGGYVGLGSGSFSVLLMVFLRSYEAKQFCCFSCLFVVVVCVVLFCCSWVVFALFPLSCVCLWLVIVFSRRFVFSLCSFRFFLLFLYAKLTCYNVYVCRCTFGFLLCSFWFAASPPSPPTCGCWLPRCPCVSAVPLRYPLDLPHTSLPAVPLRANSWHSMWIRAPPCTSTTLHTPPFHCSFACRVPKHVPRASCTCGFPLFSPYLRLLCPSTPLILFSNFTLIW